MNRPRSLLDPKGRILLLIGVLTLVAGSSGSGEEPDVRFRYPLSADHVLLEYAILPGMLQNAGPGESLRIFGDGRVEIFIQPGLRTDQLRRGGHYTTYLPDSSIQAILKDIEASSMLHFDEAAVRSERRAARSGRTVTDVSPTRIRIDVDGYQRGRNTIEGPIRVAVDWPFSLSRDAEHHPRIAGIQTLSACATRLHGWVFRIAESIEADEVEE